MKVVVCCVVLLCLLMVGSCATTSPFCKTTKPIAENYLPKAEATLALLETLPPSAAFQPYLSGTRLAIATFRQAINGICPTVAQFEAAQATVDSTAPVAMALHAQYFKSRLDEEVRQKFKMRWLNE